MTGTTTNLGLPQWAESDYVLMGEFNAAFAALDQYVNTVNGQLNTMRTELRNALSRRIDEANLNALRAVMALRMTKEIGGVLRNAYIGVLHHNLEERSECTDIIGYNTNWDSDPYKAYYVPAVGHRTGDIMGDNTEAQYNGTVRRTITLGETYRHLTLVAYVRGTTSSSIANAWPQLQWTKPVRYPANYTGATVTCKVNNAAAASRGYRESRWFEEMDETIGSNSYTTYPDIREYEFSIDGIFTGQTVVEFPLHAGENNNLACLGFAVVMS